MKGFTLIECLIYMALLALLITASHACLIAIAHSADRIQAETLVLSEGMAVYEQLREDIQMSSAAVAAETNLLVLRQYEHVTSITRTNEQLVYETDDVSLPLTSPEISVQAFNASVHASGTDPLQLSIEYELRVPGYRSRSFSYVFYL